MTLCWREGEEFEDFEFELTHGTKVEAKPPKSVIKNVDVENIKGSFWGDGECCGE